MLTTQKSIRKSILAETGGEKSGGLLRDMKRAKSRTAICKRPACRIVRGSMASENDGGCYPIPISNVAQ